MSKNEEATGAKVLLDMNELLRSSDGSLIFSREKEMLERIEKMEGQVKSWIDGLLDLNERVRRLDSQQSLEINRVTNLETRVKEIPKALNEELVPLVEKVQKLIAFVDMKDAIRRKEIEVLEERLEKLEKLEAAREITTKEGGWNEPGST